MLDKVLNFFVCFFAVAIIVMSCLLYSYLNALDSKGYSEYGYYRMKNALTPEGIHFYVHGNNVYLDSTFYAEAGKIYCRDDGSLYIKYKGVEYDISEDDLYVYDVGSPDK